MRVRLPFVATGAVVVAVLGAGCATTPAADDPTQVKLNDLDARVARIERIISNQSLVELAQHLDQVQADVRQLRGRLEELEYNTEAMKKQNRDLYNDLDKRVAALGGGGSAAGAGTGSGTSAGSVGATTGSAAAAGGAAGTAASSGGTSGGAGSATPPASAATGTDAPGGTSEEQTVYAQSFDALKAGSYSVAITGFKDFLSSYPSSPLAENAQYWLGEAYYVTHDLNAASSAFKAVLTKYPDGRKAPDALLKLGFTQLEQKNLGAGRSTLQQVVQKYPNTDAAKRAADRLAHTPAK
jgi:tol-pal system protein YbgF